MNQSSTTNGEFETEVGELESDEFEFEFESARKRAKILCRIKMHHGRKPSAA
jgi:hypothetical protein